MASCITPQWSNAYCPQVRLTVTQSASTDTSATLSWSLDYVAHGYGANVSSRTWTVKVGSVTKTGTCDISGVTGTKKLASGTVNITKTTSSQKIAFSVSFPFELSWSGVYGGTKTASESITVSAKTSYTITYNGNGHTGGTVPSSQTKWHDVSITLSTSKPTKTGHTFQGWATSASGAKVYDSGNSYTTNASVTLYAVWKANTYTVTYNANGGSGAPSAQTKTYGKALTLSNTKPTRTNYTFLGWSASKTATAATYSAGGSYTANAAVTLYAVWSLSYTKPRINGYSVDRCAADGTLSDTGTYALVKFTWKSNRAISSIVVNFVPSSGSTVSIPFTASGTSGTVNKVVGGSLTTETTYTAHLVVTDSGGYSEQSRTLNGTSFVMDIFSEGKGIAFGKPAELEGYADYAWDILFNNEHRIWGRDINGVLKEAFQPMNENGNTVMGWGNYDKKDGNTNVYGYDVHIGVSNVATPNTYRPYRRQGDVVEFTSAKVLKTAGYVTNAGTDVAFLVPFACPIVGNPTVTVTSNSGFVLRQDGKYTHGSSASTYTIPASYTAVVSQFCGVYITAKFSDVTNVINNAPIGILWSGTITFT